MYCLIVLRPEAQIKVSVGLVPSGCEEESSMPLPYGGLLAIFGVSWLVETLP